MKNSSLRLGILVSGEGTNLQAVLDAISEKRLSAEVGVVLSNHPSVIALERARKAGIPTAVFELKDFPDRILFDQALAKELKKNKIDLVVFAGFLHLVSGPFLEAFPGRILNVHPALLPDDPSANQILLPDGTVSTVFRGLHAVKQALESGVKWTGCSVHLVTAAVDQGPVLKREYVPILPGDTVESLHARIKKEEHKILPLAIAYLGTSPGMSPKS